jgi:hypothetical protein
MIGLMNVPPTLSTSPERFARRNAPALAAVMFATRRMELRSDGDIASVATEVAS